MQTRINLMALALVVCAFQAAPAAGTNTTTAATPGNPVIARGTGFEITRGDLDEALSGVKQNIPAAQLVPFEKQVLNDMINTRLLLAKATDVDRQAGKKAADLQATAAVENLGSQAALEEKLKASGVTEDVWRARLADAGTAQAALQRELKISVTDDEVKKYYDGHTADFEQPELAHVSHILIFTVDPVTHAALPGAQLDARRKLSENLVKAARAGADFDKLAKQYSEDPGSKADGGELLPFPRGQMAPEIDAAAFSLTNNQVSDVITTGIGYQIIKQLGKIPSKKVDYLTAIADIRRGLTQQKTAQLGSVYLENLKKAASVEILDPNLRLATGPANGAAAPTPVVPAKP